MWANETHMRLDARAFVGANVAAGRQRHANLRARRGASRSLLRRTAARAKEIPAPGRGDQFNGYCGLGAPAPAPAPVPVPDVEGEVLPPV